MFRKNKRPVSEVQTRELEFFILKPDCGLQILDTNIPTDAAEKNMGFSRFRVIPSFDENGNEDDPLNPVADASTEFADAIGPWARPIEIVYRLGPKQMSFITETWVSETGQTFNDKWTLARQFLAKLWKVLEEVEDEIIKAGPRADTRIPKAWVPWVCKWDNQGRFYQQRKRVIGFPYDAILLQVMVRALNGIEITDRATGQPTWLPGKVIWLPRSAASKFYQDLKTKQYQDQPLTVRNNMVGDPVTSAGGRCLYLKKYEAKAATAKSDKSQKNWSYSVLLDQEATPLPVEYTQAAWRPWDQILLQPTLEQVMQWLATAFSWDAVAFGLAESSYEELVPKQHMDQVSAIIDKLNGPVYSGPAPTPEAAPSAPQPQHTTVQAGPVLPPVQGQPVQQTQRQATGPVLPPVQGQPVQQTQRQATGPVLPPVQRAPVQPPVASSTRTPVLPGGFQPAAGIQGPKPGRISPVPPTQPVLPAQEPADIPDDQEVAEGQEGDPERDDDIPFKEPAAQAPGLPPPSVGLPAGTISPEDHDRFKSALAGIRGKRQ